jgi:Domain of unknown function (DUF4145)
MGGAVLDSWWELGEGSGLPNAAMEPWRLECAFCGEKGNFALAYHAEKKKANSSKKLNFDVYQCRNCIGYIHVLWSTAEFANFGRGRYDFKTLPWPIGKPDPSEHWPPVVQRFWVQAKDSITNENWDAAAVMARSALQFALRDKGATPAKLFKEIEELANRGILHPLMKDWSHEVRELGNDSAHPDLNAPPTDPKDARDIVQFLDFLLMYLYDLPKHISDYRQRRNP